jgi:hypothetical protein
MVTVMPLVISHLESGARLKCLEGNTRGYVLIWQEQIYIFVYFKAEFEVMMEILVFVQTCVWIIPLRLGAGFF